MFQVWRGSLAFSLHIMVDSEKRPDTLPHCWSLTCFVSTSADISLVNITDSSLSGHSLLWDTLSSTLTRQYIKYNTNSLSWHSRTSRVWPNWILILPGQKKSVSCYTLWLILPEMVFRNRCHLSRLPSALLLLWWPEWKTSWSTCLNFSLGPSTGS